MDIKNYITLKVLSGQRKIPLTTLKNRVKSLLSKGSITREKAGNCYLYPPEAVKKIIHFPRPGTYERVKK